MLCLTFAKSAQAQPAFEQIQSLLDHLKEQVAADDTAAVQSFNKLMDACKSAKNDTMAISGVDLITDYYLKHQNYYEAIRWYYFATDSLCEGGLGVCIKMRREFSDIFARVGDYTGAIELYQRNLRLFKVHQRRAAESLECSSIATLYLFNKQEDSARVYYEQALAASRYHHSRFGEVHAHNNLGFFFAETGEVELAEKHYLEGIRLLGLEPELTAGQKNQLALLKGNLGGLYLSSGQVEKGIPLLEEDMAVNLGTVESDMGLNAAVTLADHFYKSGEYGRAIGYLKQCLPYETSSNTNKFVRIFLRLFRNTLAMGKSVEANRYYQEYEKRRQDEMKAVQAEKLAIEKSLLGNILESQLAYQQKEIALKEKENETLEERSRYLQWRSVVIGWSVFIGIVFFVFYVRKRMSMLKIKRQLAEQELRLERVEKEKVDTELKYKNKDLTDFAIDLARKQEILQELKEKLYELRNRRLDELESKKQINELIQYANNNMLVDNQLMEFQRNIEEINYRFFDSLKERFPELTELDKQVCALIRLGLSNKEIAIMRNVSYKAVRMSRYRIRKKMQLDSEEDMVDFLKAI